MEFVCWTCAAPLCNNGAKHANGMNSLDGRCVIYYLRPNRVHTWRSSLYRHTVITQITGIPLAMKKPGCWCGKPIALTPHATARPRTGSVWSCQKGRTTSGLPL
eukprot:6218963-Amphidinium_carterae.1